MVSIIVPVYNAEKYLCKCLDSISAQTFQDWECILVDDGSPDRCGEICDEYAAKNTRFKAFHKTNGGSVSARKYGVERAIGTFLFWVDADDWLRTDCLEKMVLKAQETKCDIVWCDVEIVLPDRTFSSHLNFSESSEEMLRKILEGKTPSWSWNKLVCANYYRSKLVHYAIGDDMLEDFYQSVQLLVGKPLMAHVTEPLYCYNRTNTEAFTAANQYVITKRGLPNTFHVYDFLRERGLFERYKVSFAYHAMRVKAVFMLNGEIEEARNMFPFAHKIAEAYPVHGAVRAFFYLAFNGGFLGKFVMKAYLMLKGK